MKNVAMILALVLAGTAMAQTVDLKKSQIKWTGSTIAKSHNGVIGIKEARIESNKAGEPTSGRIVVDMTTIDVQDLSGDGKKGLTQHLSSPDFFDVEGHKEAVFAAKKFTKLSSEKNGNAKYKVDGDLTIRGKTNSESIEMMVAPDKKIAKVSGDLKFDRTKYDIKYNSTKATNFVSLAKDKLINDTIELNISLALMAK